MWCLLINLVGFCVGGTFTLALFKSNDLDQARPLALARALALT